MTASSGNPPVHRIDLEGQERVDSGCLMGESAGTKRKICTTRSPNQPDWFQMKWSFQIAGYRRWNV